MQNLQNSDEYKKTKENKETKGLPSPILSHNENINTEEIENELSNRGTQIYMRRYIILLMFVILSASNAMQWIEYSIIAHIITHYYNVSYSAVDWTSMIYMTMYMLLIFPGRFILIC